MAFAPNLADPVPIILHHTTSDTAAPSLLYPGEAAVAHGPTRTKLWVGDGTTNRLLLSTDVADGPLLAVPPFPLSVANGGTGSTSFPAVSPAGVGVTNRPLLTGDGSNAVLASPVWGTGFVQTQGLHGIYYTNDASGPYVGLRKGRGTVAVPTATQANDTLGSITWAGHPEVASSPVQLVARANQLFSAAAAGSRLEFHATPNGSVSDWAPFAINDGDYAVTINQNVSATGGFGAASTNLGFKNAVQQWAIFTNASGNFIVNSMPGFSGGISLTPTGKLTPSGAAGGTGPDATFGATPNRGLRPFVVGGPEGPLGIANSNAEIGYWEKAGFCVASWGNNQGTDTPYLSLMRGRNTRAAPQAVQANDILGSVIAQGHPFIVESFATIAFRANENFTATAQGSRIDFTTVNNGTVVASVRFIVGPAGDLVMPPAPPQHATLPWMISPWDDSMWIGHQINWTGLRIGMPNGDLRITGTVAEKPGGGAWTPTSDSRLKRDVEAYTRGLDAILALNPVSFCYNGRGETINDGTRYVGLEAEATREVMPEIVGTTRVKLDPERRRAADGHVERDMPDTDVLTVDPNALWYALINATKELDARLSKLEMR